MTIKVLIKTILRDQLSSQNNKHCSTIDKTTICAQNIIHVK